MTEEREIDANTEGESPRTIPVGEHSSIGQESSSDPFGKGETRTGFGGSKLFTDPGPGIRGIDFGNGDTETPKRKRGRPKGSTGKSTAKLSPDKLESARRKFTGLFGGLVGFAVDRYGMVRAHLYKKFSMELAGQVYSCYQLPEEKTNEIGQPLADTFINYFPQYVETASKGVDPGLAIVRLFRVLQEANEKEKVICSIYQQRFTPPQQPPMNGHTMPGSETENVEGVTEEWKAQTPTPEEIHPDYTSVSA